MEDVKNFLRAVLEPTGLICLAWAQQGDPEEIMHQQFIPAGKYDMAVNLAVQLDKKGKDVYFCVSTLIEKGNRKGANAKACKVFKLDIDIDPNNLRKYASREEAIIAFEEVRTKLGLPMPVYVKSGGGVHVYIIVAEPMDPVQTDIMSAKFKAVCIHNGIKADHGITADKVRILRVPGTHNHKIPDKPRLVKIASPIMVYDNETVFNAIENAYAEVPADIVGSTGNGAKVSNLFEGMSVIPAHIRSETLDDATRRLWGVTPKSFKMIMLKNEGTDGCQQLKGMHERREQLSEPEWRAQLSIASNCDDGPEMIHLISKDHPGYSYDKTEVKAQGVMGKPQRCVTFNGDIPGVCPNCQHWGKITSPIQLGDYVPFAKPTDNVVQGRNKMFDEEDRTYIIPQYPFPYVRGKDGGVYLPNEDATKPPLRICKYDFYAVRRLKARDNYIVQFRVHKPMDGVLEFAIPSGEIGASSKLQNFLNAIGIMAVDKNVDNVRSYIIRWMDYMEERAEAEYVKEQFGWTPKYKSFVVGAAEYTPNETLFSPPSPEIADIAAMFKKEGTFEAWRDAFNTYTRPGAEAHAFSAVLGFATVLMPFTGLSGTTVNLMNKDSGIGKTVSMFAQLSIWGDPKAQLLSYDDKDNAKIHRLGIMKNLPLGVDEMTLVKTEDICKMIFDVSFGRGRNRMQGSSNSERVNNTKWSTIVTMSSNANFTDKIQVERVGSNGEMARLIEIKFDAMPGMEKHHLDDLAEIFMHNYGHASEKYIKYILCDVAGVHQRLKDEIRRFDQDVQVQSGERFWTAVFACAYLGGKLAKECGLHSLDMEHLRAWMINTMQSVRTTAKLNKKGSDRDMNMLGEFLTMQNGKSVVAYWQDKTSSYMVPEPPRNEVNVRYEPDYKHVYIVASVLKEYCTKRNVHMQVFLEEQKAKGVFIKETTKRMLTGFMPCLPVRVYQFYMEPDVELVPGVIKD